MFSGVGGSVKRERGEVGMLRGASSLGAPRLSVSCWKRQNGRTGSERALGLHYSCSSDLVPEP